MTGRRVLVGVDGGGTTTRMVAVDEGGTELARLETSTANPALIGHDRAAAMLAAGLEELARHCGMRPPFAAGWLGLAGGDRPEDHDRLRPVLTALFASITFTSDAELILGALPDGVGVAVVAGTGSIAVARSSSGRRVRAGGWGHLFSDEGSGYDLGVRALRAFAAEADGCGSATSLTERLTERFQLAEPHQLIAHVYGAANAKAGIAALAPLVLDEAAAGDTVAATIVDRAAASLASIAIAAARQLDETDRVPLALTGGLLLHHIAYRERVLGHTRAELTPDRVELVHDPALTAARALAMGQADTR